MKAHCGATTRTRSWGACVFRTLSSYWSVAAVNLSYKLKLYPSANKADTLALLTALFVRHHTEATHLLVAAEGRPFSTKGQGEFIGRACRRAFIDFRRGAKAARALKKPHKPGHLKAELIDAAEIQLPRKATGFDLWVLIRGTKEKGGFYVPANRHHGINKTLALPGAILNESAEVFRKNGQWYARVSVSVPITEPVQPNGWIGVDVGVRKSITRSDGYQGPDLRPILKKQRDRRAMQQKHGIDKRSHGTFQKQVLAKEARRAVSVAQRTGRGIALEDPKRLPRWKQWAGRFFAERVLLLCQMAGVTVHLIAPPYTSITCSLMWLGRERTTAPGAVQMLAVWVYSQC